jgi:hypothetical protein
MSMTLRDMIQELFAVQTAAKHQEINVLTTQPPTLIANNNPNRLSLIISNIGTFPVYCKFEQDFAAPDGILLAPNGGFIAFLWDEDFDVVGWSMHGLATGGASQVNVLEILSI